MAIFNKSNQRPDYSANITTLAAGSSFTGKVEIECLLHIDGVYNGDITSTSIIEIGKAGVMKGELTANKLIVAGKFTGNAECESIELVSGSKVQGKLTAASLAIDGGSSFQGESIRKKPSDSANPSVIDFASETDSFSDAGAGSKKGKGA